MSLETLTDKNHRSELEEVLVEVKTYRNQVEPGDLVACRAGMEGEEKVESGEYYVADLMLGNIFSWCKSLTYLNEGDNVQAKKHR